MEKAYIKTNFKIVNNFFFLQLWKHQWKHASVRFRARSRWSSTTIKRVSFLLNFICFYVLINCFFLSYFRINEKIKIAEMKKKKIEDQKQMETLSAADQKIVKIVTTQCLRELKKMQNNEIVQLKLNEEWRYFKKRNWNKN